MKNVMPIRRSRAKVSVGLFCYKWLPFWPHSSDIKFQFHLGVQKFLAPFLAKNWQQICKNGTSFLNKKFSCVAAAKIITQKY